MPGSLELSESSACAPLKPNELAAAMLVSQNEEDHELLDHLFVEKQWRLFRTRTVQGALTLLRTNHIPVIVSDTEVPDGGWKKILSTVQQLAHPPLLVVTSRLADEHLWAEVLNLGGHDVLAKPFRLTELVWVLENAWRRFGVCSATAL